MPIGSTTPVTPPRRPRPTGLLAVAEDITPEPDIVDGQAVDRWRGGAGVDPDSCSAPQIIGMECGPSTTKLAATNPAPIVFEPVMVVAGDACSTMSGPDRRQADRARRALESSATYALEYVLWTGDAVDSELTFAVTGSSRASNVVTADLQTPHGGAANGVVVGAWVTADLGDNGYDGTFQIVGVPDADTIQWGQTAGDDATGGTGTIRVRSVSVERPHLQSASATTPAGTGALEPVHGFAVMDQALSACLRGAQGMIHVTPYTAVRLKALGLIDRDPTGTRWLSPSGHVIVVGSGYTGGGPRSASTAPVPTAPTLTGSTPSDQWIYGTAMVGVLLGEVQEDEVVDRSVNTRFAIAERPAAAVFACCQTAVQLDFTP